MRRTRLLLRASAPLLVACAIVTAGATTARADDITELEGMLSQTVVTTASKSAETATTAPATSTTLTADDMRRYGIHSIAEALDFLSLGVVTGNTLNAPDVGARGVTLPNDSGDHFLLLINGHAVNEPLFGTARFDQGAGIPLEMIDHIEVILGPGSVLYGSNAMLGVINVVTKRAKDWSGVHVVGEGAASPSAQVAGPSRLQPTTGRVGVGAGYEFKLFGTPSEVTMMADYYRQSGPDFRFAPQSGWTVPFTGQPQQFRSDGQNPGTWGGVSPGNSYYAYVPSAQLRLISGNLELNLHASTYQRSQPYRSHFTNPYNDFDNPGYELDRSAWFDLKYRAPISSVLQTTVRVYGDTFDYQGYINTSVQNVCRFIDVRTCQFHLVGASRWAGVEVQASLDWLKNGSFVTLLGLDGRTRLVQSKTDTNVLTAGPEYVPGQHLRASFGVIDTTDHVLGAYLQQTWRPIRWLGFNAGVRLDSETRYSAVASPRVAASATLWKNGTLKAIYSQAFRAPSWAETNFTAPTQEATTGLVPEHVRSVEGSLEQRVGAETLFFGVFRSWWTDMVEEHVLTPQEVATATAAGLISQFEGSYFAQYRNVSSIDNYGFNGTFSGTAGDGAFRYAVNVTGSVAHRQDPVLGTTPVFVSPTLFGNARASYALPGNWPTLAAVAQFMGKRLADRAYEGEFSPLPYAPPQVELRGTISGRVGLTGLSYRLFGDYAFATRGPYVVGPGVAAGTGPADLVPVNQLQLGVGLQYDFLGQRK